MARIENCNITRGIIIGTYSEPLENPISIDTHKWNVYVRGYNEDLSFISSVVFKLHETFDNPVRVIKESPFMIEECGWGEFLINIKLCFEDDKSVSTSIFLKFGETPVRNERYDEIVFRSIGESFFQKLSASSDYRDEEFMDKADAEYNKIESAIAHIIKKFK